MAPLFEPTENSNTVLEIEDIEVVTFTVTSHVEQDDEGHSHPGEAHETEQHLTRILAEDGHVGYCRGSVAGAIDLLCDILIGRDAFDREAIWQKLYRVQRLHNTSLSDPAMAVVDQALWDLAGRYLDLPVSKILGATRERVPAYASTMIGDEIEGGLATPEDYANFAEACLAEGYQAYKLHTWFPPIDQDADRDVAACRAVHERVGDEMVLMLDCSPHYSRLEARRIGKALEELDFHWYEEPMHEHSMSAYQWLREEVDVPICGPEMQQGEGKMGLRAEWIKHGACDVARTGIWDVGGITPVMKTVGLCESFGIPLELHGGGAGHLQVLGAMGIPGEYYERGLLHPMIDREPPAWLNEPVDPMDSDGYVHVPQRPGLGYDIDWTYVEEHRVDASG